MHAQTFRVRGGGGNEGAREAHLDRSLLIKLRGGAGDARRGTAGVRGRAGSAHAQCEAAAAGGVPVARAEGVAVVRVLREGVAARADEELGALRDVERHDRVIQVGLCGHHNTCMRYMHDILHKPEVLGAIRCAYSWRGQAALRPLL